MSGLLRRLQKLEERLQGPVPEYDTVGHLITWLSLPDEKRARTRKPKLTRELLDAVLDHRPWFIDPANLRPEVDEEGNETYPPNPPEAERPGVLVMGVYSCSALLEKHDMSLYDLAELLSPGDGIQFANDYIGIPRRDSVAEKR